MPLPTIRHLVRTVVLKTNPYWPFECCNQWPYEAALRILVGFLRARPEIRSVYLRRVLAHRQWVPALSDIDITIIFQRGLPEEQEFDLLASFWKTHDRLKHLFPMLGEIEILDEEEFVPWLGGIAYTPQSPSWTLLHGRPNAGVLVTPSAGWRRNALNLALWIYVDTLPPCLAMPDSLVRRRDILRRVEKILRLLEPILAEAGKAHLAARRGEDPADLIADALAAFEAAVTSTTSIRPSHQGSQSLINTRTGETMLVIGDGLGRDAIARLLRSGELHPPLLALSRCLLAYRARYHDPFGYSDFIESWTPVRGEHPLAEIAPPGSEELAASARHRIADLFTFTHSDAVFSKPLSMTVLDRELNRAINAARLLRREFPDRSEALESIKAMVDENRLQEARRASFRLFRSIGHDTQLWAACFAS